MKTNVIGWSRDRSIAQLACHHYQHREHQHSSPHSLSPFAVGAICAFGFSVSSFANFTTTFNWDHLQAEYNQPISIESIIVSIICISLPSPPTRHFLIWPISGTQSPPSFYQQLTYIHRRAVGFQKERLPNWVIVYRCTTKSTVLQCDQPRQSSKAGVLAAAI